MSSVVPLLSSTENTPKQVAYTVPGTYTFIPPAGVTSVCVVAIGGGGGGGRDWAGGGGGLGYKNNITVVPGNSYTVVVGAAGIGSYYVAGSFTWGSDGGDSYFIDTSTVKGGGGGGGGTNAVGYVQGIGGTYTGDGGGNGGTHSTADPPASSAGGGGAGGYSGTGGTGGIGGVFSPGVVSARWWWTR
jgi:hypothetical protein